VTRVAEPDNGPNSSAPRVIGRYAIYDAIAAGGMATVHYGRLLGPVGFSRTVAIKRLHPQFAQDPEFVAMFLDEARVAARIRHPNVVSTLDVVAVQNEIFLVMDYVHGESLARILRDVNARGEGVPLPIAIRIATDVLQGLHAAHDATDEQGVPLRIVHRDISPHNILIGVDGIARLVDFGVAKAAGRSHSTREGHLKGKLGYMAPEQLKSSSAVTRQADIHSFGVVFWEMLAGRRLFLGDSEVDTVARVVRHEVPLLRNAVEGVTSEVDAVIRRGVAEDLDDRFATARGMCVALEACGPMASTMQVADWVQLQAKESIDVRSAALGNIERGQAVTGTQLVANTDASVTGSAKEWVDHLSSNHDLSAEAKQAEAILAARAAEPEKPAEPGKDVGPAATNVVLRPPSGTPPGAVLDHEATTLPPGRPTADTPSLPPDSLVPPPLAPRAMVWAAGVVCVALLVGTLWVVKGRLSRTSSSTAASPAPVTLVATADPGPSIPPVPPAAEPGDPLATPSLPSAAASSPASPASAEVAPAPRATAPRTKTTPAKPSCNPPFTVDSQGVRVPKRECFR